MASTEAPDIVPTLIAIAVIGITIHLTNGLGILTTLIAKLSLKRKAMQKASEAAEGSVTGVFIHPGEDIFMCCLIWWLQECFISHMMCCPYCTSQVPSSCISATSPTGRKGVSWRSSIYGVLSSSPMVRRYKTSLLDATTVSLVGDYCGETG